MRPRTGRRKADTSSAAFTLLSAIPLLENDFSTTLSNVARNMEAGRRPNHRTQRDPPDLFRSQTFRSLVSHRVSADNQPSTTYQERCIWPAGRSLTPTQPERHQPWLRASSSFSLRL